MINKKILNYLEKNIGRYKIIELEQDASLRRYFRINSQNKNYIFMDSSKVTKQFDLLLEVNKVLLKFVKINLNIAPVAPPVATRIILNNIF